MGLLSLWHIHENPSYAFNVEFLKKKIEKKRLKVQLKLIECKNGESIIINEEHEAFILICLPEEKMSHQNNDRKRVW